MSLKDDMKRIMEMPVGSFEVSADPARVRTALTLLRLVEEGWGFPFLGESFGYGIEFPKSTRKRDTRMFPTLPEAIEAAERAEREG